MQKKIFLGDRRPNIIKNCLTINAVRQLVYLYYFLIEQQTLSAVQSKLCLQHGTGGKAAEKAVQY